jgi:hypothetical protein
MELFRIGLLTDDANDVGFYDPSAVDPCAGAVLAALDDELAVPACARKHVTLVAASEDRFAADVAAHCCLRSDDLSLVVVGIDNAGRTEGRASVSLVLDTPRGVRRGGTPAAVRETCPMLVCFAPPTEALPKPHQHPDPQQQVVCVDVATRRRTACHTPALQACLARCTVDHDGEGACV